MAVFVQERVFALANPKQAISNTATGFVPTGSETAALAASSTGLTGFSPLLFDWNLD